mmetsp:Transcript_36910/g.47705  ORF Transcript_36910/g.47705 Transcript_36910/m.47705 type:complete len:107 (+) Transcript_36910:273-593(+)
MNLEELKGKMLRELPRRIWLQIHADWPDGEYCHPDLSVNKILKTKVDVLKKLIPVKNMQNNLMHYKNKASGIFVNTSKMYSCTGQGNIVSKWIYIDRSVYALPEGC